MGKRQTGAGLIRETVQHTLTETGDILAQHVQDHLFHHKNQIIMAFNFEHIQSLPDVATLLKDKGFRDEYIDLYNRAHLSKNGAAHYAREIGFLKQMFVDNTNGIQEATPLSIAMALSRLAYCGLSIEPIPKALAYIYPAKGGGGKVFTFAISAYGKLALRLRYKVLTSVNGPYLVFKGDHFRMPNGKVDHDPNFESDEIIGGWMTVNRPDGTSADSYFSIAQLNNYKKKGAGGGEAWTGGIEVEDEEGNTKKQGTRGMYEAKILSHTMDLYPITDRRLENGADILTADAALANSYADQPVPDTYADDDGIPYTEEVDVQETQAPTQVTKAAPAKAAAVDPADF